MGSIPMHFRQGFARMEVNFSLLFCFLCMSVHGFQVVVYGRFCKKR
jgi:hypothetical protein